MRHAVECWYVPVSDMQWSGGMFLHETCSGLVECSSNRHVVEPSNVPYETCSEVLVCSYIRHAVEWWNVPA